MPAYFIVDIDIRDAAFLEEYRNRIPATLSKYGGRYIVRDGKFEKLEGTGSLSVEFPSVKQAKEWYDSEDYRPLKAMRLNASSSNVILVEAV